MTLDAPLLQLVALASRSPSGHNTQPWTLVRTGERRLLLRSNPAAGYRWCEGSSTSTVGLGQPGGRRQRGDGEEHQHGQGGPPPGVVGQDAKQRGEHATNADGQANGEATGGADASGKVLLGQRDLDAERDEEGQAKHGTSDGGKPRAGSDEQAGQAGQGQRVARSDRSQPPGAVGQPAEDPPVLGWRDGHPSPAAGAFPGTSPGRAAAPGPGRHCRRGRTNSSPAPSSHRRSGGDSRAA
jgi:hypothetical protein